VLLPSISASARSTVGTENDDEPKGPTRLAAGVADASVERQKMLRRSRVLVYHSSSQGKLVRASGC
jgi:hypothetical protein